MVPDVAPHSAVFDLIRPDRIYSQSQLACLMGVHWRTVARWRIHGKTTPSEEQVHLIGFSTGRWRYAGSDVREFLAATQPKQTTVTTNDHSSRQRRSHVDAALDAAGF